MLEMVTNSETLANIHVQEGGALSQFFSKGSIKNWMDKAYEGTKSTINNLDISSSISNISTSINPNSSCLLLYFS